MALGFSIKKVISRISYLLEQNNLQICVTRIYSRNNFKNSNIKGQENLNVSHFKTSISMLIRRSHVILRVSLNCAVNCQDHGNVAVRLMNEYRKVLER